MKFILSSCIIIFLKIQLDFVVGDEVTFELYTLKNPMTPQILSPHNKQLNAYSYLNRHVPTRFYIHGWQEWNNNMKSQLNDAYLLKAKQDINLIAVNWETRSHTPLYNLARNRVKPIGIYVANMIDFLVENGLSINDINIIGFSLGAHIAGIAGKNVKSGLVPKIIALDPARPLFSLDKPGERLHKADAKYVEVIHTNGAEFGIYYPIGTVNFYPNGGAFQPGCRSDVCSHLRSIKYFAESINSPFYAYPCESFDAMKHGNCRGIRMQMGGDPGNYRNQNSGANIYYLTIM